MIAEYDDGSLEREYLYGPSGRVAINTFGADTRHYYLADQVASTQILLGAEGSTKGRIRGNYDYYPYGNLKKRAVYTPQQRMFGGHHLHEEIGFDMYYMGARFYDPATMRFMSVDPAGQYFSPYIYGGGNPVIGVDPNGELFIIDNLVRGFIRGLIEGHGWDFHNAWETAKQQAKNSYDIWRGLFETDPRLGFWGRAWQLVSRLTWESPQATLGQWVNLTDNTFGGVKSVDHAYGATLVERYARRGAPIFEGAFTLPPYINAPRGTQVGDDLFMHEYGHFLQSKRVGRFYPALIIVPSVTARLLHGGGEEYHSVYPENWANDLAREYFGDDWEPPWNEGPGISAMRRKSQSDGRFQQGTRAGSLWYR